MTPESLLLLILYGCTWSFSDDRSKGVSIRIRSQDITTIHDRSIDLVDESKWKEVKMFEVYGDVGIARPSQPQLARYVAVSRNGLINLKEVQIYQKTCEWLCKVGRYEVTHPQCSTITTWYSRPWKKSTVGYSLMYPKLSLARCTLILRANKQYQYRRGDNSQ